MLKIRMAQVFKSDEVVNFRFANVCYGADANLKLTSDLNTSAIRIFSIFHDHMTDIISYAPW